MEDEIIEAEFVDETTEDPQQLGFGFPKGTKKVDPGPAGDKLVLIDGSRTDRPDTEAPLDIQILPDYEVTMENFKQGMIMGVFKNGAALMSQSNYLYGRLPKVRMMGNELDKYLLEPARLKDLSPEDKLELYKLIRKDLIDGPQYLLDFHNSMPKVHDNLNSADRMKDYNLKEKKSEESGDDEIATLIYDELKKKIDEETQQNK